MPKNINFLLLRKKEKIKRKHGLVLVRMGAVLYLFLIVSLAVLGFFLERTASLDTAKEKEAAFVNTLAPFRSKEAKLLLIKDRISGISEIIKKREEVVKEQVAEKSTYAKIIGAFSDKIPQDVIVNTLNVDGSKVILNVSSSSLLPIENMLDGLEVLGKDKIISELLVDSLSLSSDKGIYSVLVTANL